MFFISYCCENLRLVNIDTGEFRELGYGTFIPKELLDKRKEFFKKQEEIKIINAKFRSYGNFTWLEFKYGEELFPNMKLGHIARLLYLSTFITYDGILKTSNHAYMTKANMNKLLKLSAKQFYEFYNEMVNKKIIIENTEENCLLLNKDLFFKGTIEDKSTYDNLIRLNHKTIRELYVNIPISKHKTLGYIFKLIPYVNKEHNILCKNPLEADIDRLELLNKTSDIAKICNYSKSKAKRLYEEMKEITLNNNPIVKIYENSISKKKRIFINSRCYYAGNDYGQVLASGAFY